MRSAVVTALVAGALLLLASMALAHDLFLKLDTYFLEPRARARIMVLNGTFAKSEGFVAPERIADISAVSPAGRTALGAAAAWSRGPDSTGVLRLGLGAAGTYVVGVSTRAREIELRAEDFNAYLEEDGIPDVERSARTGADGVAEVTLDAVGRWYVKFVHMTRASERGVDYESKWATLTFEIR